MVGSARAATQPEDGAGAAGRGRLFSKNIDRVSEPVQYFNRVPGGAHDEVVVPKVPRYY